MYGLDPQTDLRPLEGTTLTFVGFGQYQLQLVFSGDPDCAVTVEGDYVVSSSGNELTVFSSAADGAEVLLPLLGHVFRA